MGEEVGAAVGKFVGSETIAPFLSKLWPKRQKSSKRFVFGSWESVGRFVGGPWKIE